MKVLHITPVTDGYEEVELISNAVNKKNNFYVIKHNGVLYYTGGFILNDTPEVRELLDMIPKDKLYKLIWQIKSEPFVKQYYEEKE